MERVTPFLAGFLVIIGGLLALGCSPGISPKGTVGQEEAAALTRVDDGRGGVTAEGIWVSPNHLREMGGTLAGEYPLDRFALVHLSLNTHSVELARYDPMSRVTLERTGGPPTAPEQWVPLSESGHHREGVLVFAGLSYEALAEQRDTLSLVVRDVAGVPERVLTWDL
ncbi:MAG: hypothetical protein HY680_06340 [Chloroflexi bacterium]|nr:hypothetical protein [Chloroflexota bacterium]